MSVILSTSLLPSYDVLYAFTLTILSPYFCIIFVLPMYKYIENESHMIVVFAKCLAISV